ncbi:MAG: DNA-protecting protein DprA, partial [Clostridiales bacterium]|nr:DNA-protecting protein DprA [Clostridiales bacterium]
MKEINEEYFIMWLSRVHGMDNNIMDRLIEYFGSAKGVYNASIGDLYDVCGMKTAENIYGMIKNESLIKYINDLKRTGVDFVSKYNELYPEGLKYIDDKPMGIYYKGKLLDKDELMVSVVGSRRCTEYGKTATLKLSTDLAKHGITIVSGLADGVDSYASMAALDAGGRTIGVLGTAINKCYPSTNRGLFGAVIENGGCIISEYAPDMVTSKYCFIQRNRIIAALSEILVVIEAAEKSGTSTTVEAALEYGKSVFAVPGSILSKYSKGTNKMIKEGCPPVTCAEDILFELGFEPEEAEENKNKEKEIIKNINE